MKGYGYGNFWPSNPHKIIMGVHVRTVRIVLNRIYWVIMSFGGLDLLYLHCFYCRHSFTSVLVNYPSQLSVSYYFTASSLWCLSGLRKKKLNSFNEDQRRALSFGFFCILAFCLYIYKSWMKLVIQSFSEIHVWKYV